MAGANCLACLLSIKKLSGAVGGANEPVGCCSNCSSLICDYHGHRDPHAAEFMCVICDATIAAASAVSHANASSVAAQRIVAMYSGSVMAPSRWRFESAEDFSRRRPRYGAEFVNTATTLGFPPTLEEALSANLDIQDCPTDALELFRIARAIAEEFLPEAVWPAALRPICRTD